MPLPLLRHRTCLWVVADCCTHLRLLHGSSPQTLNPSISDLTVSYLIKSCGLSPAAALSVARKFTIKSTGNADSFLSLLTSYGLSQLQITNVVYRRPILLSLNPEMRIKPKLDFFLSVGYSRAGLIELICADPSNLTASLERKIRPNFNQLRSILGSSRDVAVAIKNFPQLIRINLDGAVLPNMKTLRDIGVPEQRIIMLATLFPRQISRNPNHFNQAVELLKKMGFDPSKVAFIMGINVLSGLLKATWDRKWEVYRRLRWSEEEISSAFRKHPFCMLVSDEKIKKIMEFFTEKMKWEPSYLAARPVLLSFSYEKKILPRYEIFRLLESESLVNRKLGFATFLIIPEREFIRKYVINYAAQVPQVLEIYKHKLELERWKNLDS
ncbi:hypothetical protein AXF42_Ash015818 [Apostasia shenzhenica]|uniref:Uncharacterized protein n=1 Tax=Apostasia shenzhenica TaxID=1088818 RepID=A0A2H9ZXL7_9ASPA|nr:hypothetical protein AXF42_Ash015818 [Apostasia shenzhenica]